MEQQEDGWQKQLSTAIGAAIKQARLDAGMKAVELSEKCEQLGLPIHRTTLSKIEKGRSSFDLAELIVLARALNVPPLQLIYPELPDGYTQPWPGTTERASTAARWFSGELVLVEDGDSFYYDEHDRVDGTRIGSTRRIEAALAEWSMAGHRVYALTAREASRADIDAALKLSQYAEDALVKALDDALRRGENVDLDSYPVDVTKIVHKRRSDRARRVASEIRGTPVEGDDDAAR